MNKNRANFSTRSDATDGQALVSLLRSCSSVRHSAQRPRHIVSGIDASSREPADMAYDHLNLKPEFTDYLCLRSSAFLYNSDLFCLFGKGHSPFDPGRSPLIAECRDYVTQPIPHSHDHASCLMEIKRETRPPPAGVINTTERISHAGYPLCRCPQREWHHK